MMSDGLQFLHKLGSLMSSCETVSRGELVSKDGGSHTLEILRRQEDGTDVVIDNEMAQLRCDFCAIPSHEEHLANSPVQPGIVSNGSRIRH